VNFRPSVHEVAPELIGAELYVDGVGGMVVEVEAYDHEDPAAHGFGNRRTARNASMFLGGGHVYVYRSYGSTGASTWCAATRALRARSSSVRSSRSTGSTRCVSGGESTIRGVFALARGASARRSA
jgi:3-methyladenine DNA glycosylase Mpg